MDDILGHLENIIDSSTQTATTNYESLIGSLNQYKDIIQSNRSELHPDSEEENSEDIEALNEKLDVIS